MSQMADPMIALRSLQHAVGSGDPTVNPRNLGGGYFMIYDEPNGGKRYSYAKVISGEVQALSIFGLADPINRTTCLNVGYAVSERFRGRGLAVEAVNKGIEDLKWGFTQTGKKSFYVEAVIDEMNTHSIKVAKQLFPDPGVAIKDCYSETPALQFKKLILVQ